MPIKLIKKKKKKKKPVSCGTEIGNTKKGRTTRKEETIRGANGASSRKE